MYQKSDEYDFIPESSQSYLEVSGSGVTEALLALPNAIFSSKATRYEVQHADRYDALEKYQETKTEMLRNFKRGIKTSFIHHRVPSVPADTVPKFATFTTLLMEQKMKLLQEVEKNASGASSPLALHTLDTRLRKAINEVFMKHI